MLARRRAGDIGPILDRIRIDLQSNPQPDVHCPLNVEGCDGYGNLIVTGKRGVTAGPCKCRTSGLRGFFLSGVEDELDGIVPTLQSARTNEALTAVRGYLPNRRGEWVALVGPAGSGKTFALCALVLGVLNAGPERARIPRALFVPSRKTARALRNPDMADEIINHLFSHDILLLDDVGAEHESGSTWLASIMSEIIDRAYRENKTLFLTSNLQREEFAHWLGAAQVSRFQGRGQIIEIHGKDQRLESQEGETETLPF